MKKYKVIVNGEPYAVEIDLLSEAEAAQASAQSQSAPQKTPAAKAETPAQPAPRAAAPNGSGHVLSPMPGTITSIKVKVGDAVSKKQPLFILEAMKMENEVHATADGTIRALYVAVGEAVASKALLCTIE